MSNSFVITFLIHHTHLGFSGDCHIIEYGGLSLIKYAYSRSAFWHFWNRNGPKKNFRKTQTDEGQTCDKLTPDGHLLLRFR